MAFLSLVSQVQASLSGLGGMLPRAASVVASVARVREVASLPQMVGEGRQVPGQTRRGVPVPPVGVRASGLAFSYATGREVLRDVSFLRRLRRLNIRVSVRSVNLPDAACHVREQGRPRRALPSRCAGGTVTALA